MARFESSFDPVVAGPFLSAARGTLHALAQAAIPAGRWLPAGGWPTVERLEHLLATLPPHFRTTYLSLVHAFEHAALPACGSRFSRASARTRSIYLERLYRGELSVGGWSGRTLLRVVLSPLKAVHVDAPALFERFDCPYGRPKTQGQLPRPLRERVIDAGALDGATDVDADVVVVGSGAGGGACAAELAERGLAVVVLEEGAYVHRHQFTGRPIEMLRRLYRDFALTGTVGNCVIPIPLGRCVGGTTTINSGTCYRAPERVLRSWCEDLGLDELAPERLDPYYKKVEQIVGATRADPALVGAIGAVTARGCEALGLSHHGPLTRNAPECDGSSLCCFGCPTDAKRSTNVAHVPLALRYGAQLITNARVRRILVEHGRASGVLADGPGGQAIRVRARATVLAAGTLLTPLLLMQQGLCRRSSALGRNLSIHPAAGVLALVDDEILGCRRIPQGYGVEDFRDEGILLEGAFVPPDLAAASITLLGPRFTELMEGFRHLAYMGFLIDDTSRGTVRIGPGGRPVATYLLNDVDVAKVKRGLDITCQILLAAGARAVFPQLPGLPELRSRQDLQALRAARITARDLDLTAHHPLGTCRMGQDPARSVVGPDHQAHELPGLYICDGSSVPSSLGVNPMLTIMALATRAAEQLALRLE